MNRTEDFKSIFGEIARIGWDFYSQAKSKSQILSTIEKREIIQYAQIKLTRLESANFILDKIYFIYAFLIPIACMIALIMGYADFICLWLMLCCTTIYYMITSTIKRATAQYQDLVTFLE